MRRRDCVERRARRHSAQRARVQAEAREVRRREVWRQAALVGHHAREAAAAYRMGHGTGAGAKLGCPNACLSAFPPCGAWGAGTLQLGCQRIRLDNIRELCLPVDINVDLATLNGYEGSIKHRIEALAH